MNLHEIANQPGFGTGKRARDLAAAEREAIKRLPDPRKLPPVMASTDDASNWLIASFGNDTETGEDWHLVTDSVRASETFDMALVQGAKVDAENVAAIINAYRMGVLVENKSASSRLNTSQPNDSETGA